MKKPLNVRIPLLAASLFALIFSFSACEENHPHDEGEVITTVKLICQDSASTILPVREFRFDDPDGPGGNNPTRLDTIHLDSGRTTLVSLRFEDASSGTVKDITSEIRAEAQDHLVCIQPAGVALNVAVSDSDGKYPIGLESRWKSTVKGAGTLTIVLKHQPGSKNGTCDPGDTDAEVTFPVLIR
jgi:hypothetical protein